MSSTVEEYNVLRDLVVQTLENNGILGKLRAEIRANVYMSLEDNDMLVEKSPVVNARLKTYLESNRGRLALALVREFLQFFSLDYTKQVLDSEAHCGTQYKLKDRERLLDLLGTRVGGIDSDTPLIEALLPADVARDGEDSGARSPAGSRSLASEGSRGTDAEPSEASSDSRHETSQKSVASEKNSDAENFFDKLISSNGKKDFLKNESLEGKSPNSTFLITEKKNITNSMEKKPDVFNLVKDPYKPIAEIKSSNPLTSLSRLPPLQTTSGGTHLRDSSPLFSGSKGRDGLGLFGETGGSKLLIESESDDTASKEKATEVAKKVEDISPTQTIDEEINEDFECDFSSMSAVDDMTEDKSISGSDLKADYEQTLNS